MFHWWLCFPSHCYVWTCATCCLSGLTSKYKTQPRWKYIQLWWSCYDKKIFYINLFHSYFGQLLFNDILIYQQPKLISSIWESKSISKTMCSQGYGDLYATSYLFLNPDIFRCIPLPLHKTLIFTLFELNTGGNYIIPHISFLRSFENYWVISGDSFKHHLVITKCDHFF